MQYRLFQNSFPKISLLSNKYTAITTYYQAMHLL